MGKPDYDLIIFDCDGTLVDSESICNAVLVDLVNEYSSKKYTLDYALEHWAGASLSNVLSMVQKEVDVIFPDGIAQHYIKECNSGYKLGLKSINGAVNFVNEIKHKNKICVGSNGERNNVIESLELCGFSPKLFQEDNIFTRIQVPNGKPAPDLFLFAAQKMEVTPSMCLVIEDSPTGVLAGVAAGMEVWGFTGTAHDLDLQGKKLKKAGASRVFNDFIHMSEALGY
jgi:HAD superfamily hydrolase (TIGR01509 family)